jgi:SAM-dependent methyltransferase
MTVKFPVPVAIRLSDQPCWCGSGEFRRLYEEDRWGQPLRSVICRRCGTIRLNPRMTREQAAHYYETAYPDRQREPEVFFKEQERQNAAEYLLPYLQRGMCILDYGCGPGGKLARLTRDGYFVYAYDLNPVYRSYATAAGLKEFDDRIKYDAIYLSHTVEHWTRPLEDLRVLLTRFLKDGGTVIIEVPLVDRLLLGVRSEGIRGDVYFPHIWYFSVTALDKLLSALHSTRVYTDRLTLCVYKYKALDPKSPIRPTPFRDRLLRTLISISSMIPGMSFCAGMLNRLVNYIDLSHASRVNPE